MLTAEMLYQAYGDSTGFLNFKDEPMPLWAYLPERQRSAWDAVAERVNRPEVLVLDDREQAQIRHAQDYAAHHASAGVPGHGQFLLINKLAEALGLSSQTES